MLDTRLPVGPVDLEVFTCGHEHRERTVLVLHDLDYLNGVEQPFLSRLAQSWRVLMPSHPGFGESSLPPEFDAVDDLAYVYLDLLKQTGPAHVLGFGFGGWIAAEVAIRCTQQIKSLVLVDALGIKISDRGTVDIKDFFVVSQKDLLELSWYDAQRGAQEMPLPVGDGRFDEDQLTLLLNNRRTAALVAWNPFMHHPKLRGRLRRIDCPTLVIWGAADGIVSPDYGRAYAAAIPNAEFAVIDRAGHYPYVEQPDAFVQTVEPFLRKVEAARQA